MDRYLLRKASKTDKLQIYALYKAVGKYAGGLARTADEISEQYVEHFMVCAAERGIELIIQDTLADGKIVAEIHCRKPEPKVFGHVLGDLTIAVHPDYQGQGLGRKLFQALLDMVREERRDVLRVELIVRESNGRAIEMYEKLGFVKEGRLEKRIRGVSGAFEADVPMAWFNEHYLED